QHRGFFPRHVAALPLYKFDVKVHATAKYILGHKARRPNLLGSLSQISEFLDILMIDVDIGRLRLHGIRRNQDPFQNLVGIGLEKVTVLERTRLVLSGIAYEITLSNPMIHHLLPVHAGGNASTS